MSYRRNVPQFVYFVRSHDLVKIGVSNNPKQRIQALRTASPYPVEVLCIVDGGEDAAEGRESEGVYHQMFAERHSHGEWFHADPELLAFVGAL